VGSGVAAQATLEQHQARGVDEEGSNGGGQRPQGDRQGFQHDAVAGEEGLDQQHRAEGDEHVFAEEARHVFGRRGECLHLFALRRSQLRLPALRGGLFSGSLLTFAHSLGEFGATVLVSGNLRLRTQTAPLYIFAQFEAGNVANANAVAAVLATLSFVIFFVLLRFTQRPGEEGR